MANIQVHHLNFQTNQFDPVAEVDAPDNLSLSLQLEYAFRWTNNVNGSWSKQQETLEPGNFPNTDFNPRVKVMADLPVRNGRVYGLRSTSVGDRMVAPGGKVWYVDAFGFSEKRPKILG